MSKKERFTEEHEKMATIPKLNSALFTIENYNRDNSILLYFDKMQKYAVGWCYADETTIGCGFLGEIAVMYEVSADDERLDEGKYWCHLGTRSFINLFIPKMLEAKRPSLVEELQQQLAEKDKEIERLMSGKYIPAKVAKQTLEMRDKLLKQERHQVCEEIRKSFEDEIIKQKTFYGIDDIKLHFAYIGNLLCEFDWKKILDQIEKGEGK